MAPVIGFISFEYFCQYKIKVLKYYCFSDYLFDALNSATIATFSSFMSYEVDHDVFIGNQLGLFLWFAEATQLDYSWVTETYVWCML